MAGDWGRGQGPGAGLELCSLCTDGKLQWEEEATVNRLQSNEVPVSLEYQTWRVKGRINQEILASAWEWILELPILS
jgi:hypothetical protein